MEAPFHRAQADAGKLTHACPEPVESARRRLGSLIGMMVGDALAMPVHWYYDTTALRRDYGVIEDYCAPRNPHPDSILWRSSYPAQNRGADILHDQAQFWGQRGIHYHQFLRPGENTLNLQLCGELVESLHDRRGYDEADYLRRYIAFMTEPGRHRDTYVEECHRGFFSNLADGKRPDRCGVTEKHIGGLPFVAPTTVWYAGDPKTAESQALAQLALTHPGPVMAEAGRVVVRLLLAVLSGIPLIDALRAAIDSQASPYLSHPFQRLITHEDHEVIGPRFSPACYVQDALPAVIFLALKYHDRPREGLVANTMLGGDNAHRGAVLGALLGAEHGEEAFPARWRHNLIARDKLLASMEHEQHA